MQLTQGPRSRIQHSKSLKKTPTHLPKISTTFVFFVNCKEDSGFPTWEASHVEDKIKSFDMLPSEYLSSVFLNKKNNLKIGEMNFYANKTSFTHFCIPNVSQSSHNSESRANSQWTTLERRTQKILQHSSIQR